VLNKGRFFYRVLDYVSFFAQKACVGGESRDNYRAREGDKRGTLHFLFMFLLKKMTLAVNMQFHCGVVLS
jgi:hypothetical protein